MVRKLLLAIVGLVGIVIAVAIIVPYFITVDSIKAEIIQKVAETTGRTLTIDGPLRLKIFPVAGVSAEKITLSNPPEFDDKAPFLTLDKLNVEVEFLPYLSSRTIVIRSFELENPQIKLHADKDGSKNWSFDKKKDAVATAPAKADGPAPAEAKTSLPANIILSHLDLKNASVSYIDDVAKQHYDVKRLNANVLVNGLSSPFTFKGSGEWQGKVITVNATLKTLQSFLDNKVTEGSADISSNLFSVNVDGKYDPGIFVGKGSIKSSSLKDMMAWLDPSSKPLPMSAPLALDAGSEIRCGTHYCAFPSTTITLDKIKGTGAVKISMAESQPTLELKLTVGQLDLNPFLPPEKHAGLSNILVADALADSGHWSSAPIDLSILHTFDASATIKTDGILYRKIAIGNTTLNAKLKQGHLTADVTDAQIYSGKGSIAVGIDSSASPPSFETRASFKGIQIEPLLKDAADLNRMTGFADVDINTTSRGRSQQEIVSALAGNGQMKVSDGTIKNVNILDMMHNIQSSFGNANNTSQTTKFSELGGTFTISQGVLSNKDLIMKMSDLRVSGQGSVNLPAYSINYKLTPQTIVAAKGQDGTVTEKQGIAIPVIIEGSLDNPKFRPDVGAVLQDALSDPKKFKEQLKNNRGVLKEQLKDPKAAIKNLKGLLGR